MRILQKLLFACLLTPIAVATAADATPADAAPQAVDQDPTYLIGPGDAIQVFVWRNPDLSASATVRPDGRISTPLAEEIVAAGMTPPSLARIIETRLAEYIKNPQVNVIVTGAQNVLSKVTVLGSVGNPGPVPFRRGMTLLDVVLAAGNLKEFARGNGATLTRKGPDGKDKVIPVRLKDLMKGRSKVNIPVEAGDLLFVPESRF